MTTLSPRQREILDFLLRYIRANGFAPSVREIGSAIGVYSSSTIQAHLEALTRKGRIRRVGSRAIHLLGPTGNVLSVDELPLPLNGQPAPDR